MIVNTLTTIIVVVTSGILSITTQVLALLNCQGLVVLMELLSLHLPYITHCSTGLVFKDYEFCRQVTVNVSGVSVADTTRPSSHDIYSHIM
jgi:hypothetical protein